MIVTLHQPNLFPWRGFFDKMARADTFIYLDTVQFTKRGYQNRVKIKGNQGAQWLTVPVKSKGRYFQSTNEVEIDNEIDWKKKHLNTIEKLYGGTANFEPLFQKISDVYRGEYEHLVDFTYRGIDLIRDALEIHTKTVLASSLKVGGNSSELIVKLVKEVGGSVYLSGPSGRNYLEEEVFQAENIKVEYHEYNEPEYPQKYNDFVNGLSTLDYLFNARVKKYEYMDI